MMAIKDYKGKIEDYVMQCYQTFLRKQHINKSVQIFKTPPYSIFDFGVIIDGSLVALMEIKSRDKYYQMPQIPFTKYLSATYLATTLKIECYLLNYVYTSGELYLINMLNLHHKGQFKTKYKQDRVVYYNENYACYEIENNNLLGNIGKFPELMEA